MLRRSLLKAAIAIPGARALQTIAALTASEAAVAGRPPSALHFYTASPEERDRAIQQIGYRSEGILGYVIPASAETVQTGSEQILKMQAPEAGLVPLFRSFNPPTSSHFYTSKLDEWLRAVRNLGHQPEGIVGWLVSSTDPFKPRPGSLFKRNPLIAAIGDQRQRPIHRLYKAATDDHFYTMDTLEAVKAANEGGYQNEGWTGFAFNENRTQSGALMPVYRLFIPPQEPRIEGGGGNINWGSVVGTTFDVVKGIFIVGVAIFAMQGLSDGSTRVSQGEDGSVTFTRPVP